MKRAASELASSTRGRVQWSMNGLAALGEPKSPQEATPSNETTRMLLRIADQYAVCGELIACLEKLKELQLNDTISCRTGVIRALNTPIRRGDWRMAQQEQEDWLQAANRAQRDVQNLQRLHENTFNLSYSLMDENSPVLRRFSSADRHLFFATFEQIRSRHAATVETLADTVISLRPYGKNLNELNEWIDVFLRGRLGVQLLSDHYVALHKGKRNGCVSVDCLLEDVIDDAVTESKHICDAHYETIPSIIVNIPSDATLTLVRPWIHHALVEVLKNALAESIQSSQSKAPPPIHLDVVDSDDFVSLSVVDRGRGVDNPAAAFEFASSSVENRWDRLDEQQSYAMVRSPLQSLGVGLPLSRMLLQHFGGDLELSNSTGGTPSGCTATLLLNKNADLLEQRAPFDNEVAKVLLIGGR